MRNVWFTLLIVLCTVAVGVYFVVRPTLHHETTPSVLRVGVLPDEGVEALRKRYVPLLKYLSEKTGLDFQLVLSPDYNGLVRMFGNREVELAYFGGLTFVQALDSYDAAPLVMRDVDTRFTSWFLVKGGKAAHGFSDFKGKRFTFGSRLSTSGHLMPRHFMRSEKQIIPEVFFSEVNLESFTSQRLTSAAEKSWVLRHYCAGTTRH